MRPVLALAAALVLAAGPAGAGFDDGVAAYQRGDVAAALAEWTPLAEAGDARAQFRLGKLYAAGEGVARDDAAAVSWYRRAAEQGHAEAQFELADMYAEGRGVARDYVAAYMWWELAKAMGGPIAGAMQRLIEPRMTWDQVDEALARAQAWRERRGDR